MTLREIQYNEIREYIDQKGLKNPQPSFSIMKKFMNFVNSNDFEESISKIFYTRFGISIKSKESYNLNKSLIIGFEEFMKKQTISHDQPQVNDQTQTNDQTVGSADLSDSDLEKQKEELRQKQQLAVIQAEELAKTRAEELKQTEELEKAKIALAIKKAEELAKQKEELRAQRIKARSEGFESQKIPDSVIQFDYQINIPQFSRVYYQQENEKDDFFRSCDMLKHCIMKGSAGSGKTELAIKYAHDHKMALFKLSCSSDMRMADLIGCKTFDENGNIKFEAGMLTKALLTANEYENGSIILLDEINTLSEKVQKNVNGIADGTGFIDLPTGRLRINQGSKFIVVGTMNQSYAGTNPLNPEFKDRFSMIKMPKMSRDTKHKIYSKFGVSEDLEENLISLCNRLDQLSENNTISNDVVFSTRSQISFLEILEDLEADNIPNAIYRALNQTLISKFDDPEHEEIVKDLIGDIFN
jgi:MoxR-like ATPase|tara:strand:- start:1119 stop:2531 length:1413 start_codon:yes stop_codon:yes gene_type:complete